MSAGGAAMDYWRVSESPEGILITCVSHDKLGRWPTAIATFRALIAPRLSSVRVIADLRAMTGYETEARRAWQEAFRQHRQQMLAVVFIGGTQRIRMGAAVVGAVAGVPVRFVNDWSEVERAWPVG